MKKDKKQELIKEVADYQLSNYRHTCKSCKDITSIVVSDQSKSQIKQTKNPKVQITQKVPQIFFQPENLS